MEISSGKLFLLPVLSVFADQKGITAVHCRDIHRVFSGESYGVSDDSFTFEGASGFKILQGAGFVGREVPGEFDLCFGVTGIKLNTASPGDGTGFQHQRTAKFFDSAAVAHLCSGEIAADDGNGVVRKIPQKFSPAVKDYIL